MHNVRSTCPLLSVLLINCYRDPTSLFVDGETILASEGVTQGDHLSMPFYVVSTLSLIDRLPSDVTQVWYADDAAAVGRLDLLRRWWDSLASLGPDFGYFPTSRSHGW